MEVSVSTLFAPVSTGVITYWAVSWKKKDIE